jgi:hypothetical protein
VSASVVSGVNASPVLDACEHIFDAMALSIEDAIVRVLDFAGALGRDAGRDTALGECLAEPAGVIPPVAKHGFGRRQGIDHHRRPWVIADLPLGETQKDRTTAAIAHGMKFGGQPAPAASDASGKNPFFKRLAAVRCAFRWIASIINWSEPSPPLDARAQKIRLNTPSRLQRMKRLQIVLCGP